MTDRTNSYIVRHNGATPTEQWIEFLGLDIEVSIDTDDAADGWIEFDVWCTRPEGSAEFIVSDVVLVEDWDKNGPAALQSWARVSRFILDNADHSA